MRADHDWGATQFRQWATQVLREFAIKGYVLDRRRMENGSFSSRTPRGRMEPKLQ
ncbi:MAG: RhuM family protein [Pseudomonadales bacterium]|nr:RhuM family protein [Pseudomonadales bacterium]